jgi:D-glycero-D-manno-heptose 1,7-bisphosphate phosphatase
VNRAAFLDRDGVINQRAPEGQYITRWEELHFLPGVPEAIALLNRSNFLVIVVSNQRCVASGLTTAGEVDSLHERMCHVLAEKDARIDAVYYCPHELQPACDCRKPQPGMLLKAARAHEINLPESWMIGDSDIDIEAGKNAGCKTARLMESSSKERCVADISANSLLGIVQRVLKNRDYTGNFGRKTS